VATRITAFADIDTGRLNILVGFAPLKPAEFDTCTAESAA
jgi:hypothetical protein